MIVHGVDVCRTYLAFKQHFSNPKFDFFKYDGKVKVKEETYQQRSDFYFFEVLSRKLTDMEVKEYFLSVFIYSQDPTKVWIGDVRKLGKEKSIQFHKRWESMSYLFEQDIMHLNDKGDFNKILSPTKGSPILLREYVKGNIMIETLIILDIICKYQTDWDRIIKDPVWESVSFLIKKYKPFCSINREVYKDIVLKVF